MIIKCFEVCEMGSVRLHEEETSLLCELLFQWEAAAVVICGLALLKRRRSHLAWPRRT